MVYPSCEKIQELAKDYRVIPISREIYADVTTPITLLRKISQVSKQYYLLESIEGGEKWGRYSFLGFDPIVHVTCKDKVVTIENGDEKISSSAHPLDILRGLLEKYKSPKLAGMPP